MHVGLFAVGAEVTACVEISDYDVQQAIGRQFVRVVVRHRHHRANHHREFIRDRRSRHFLFEQRAATRQVEAGVIE